MVTARKPTIVTSGYSTEVARALEPVKQSVEMITGASTQELTGLPKNTSATALFDKVNEIIARLNASGGFRTQRDTSDSPLSDSGSKVLDAYPIGSIYLSTADTSPAVLFGGTWSALPQGRVLIGAGANYLAGSTGGSETHTITIDEMPSHSHGGVTSSNGAHTHTRGTTNITGSFASIRTWNVPNPDGAFSTESNLTGPDGSDPTGRKVKFTASSSWSGETSSNGGHSHTVTSQGGGAAMNIRNPYLVVYMWERTA